MSNLSSDVLDQAIACLAQGWSVEETLQAFPADAEELRPLLHVCVALQQLAQAPCPLRDTPGTTPAWVMHLGPQECAPLEQARGDTRRPSTAGQDQDGRGDVGTTPAADPS
jgi:hypothetical protein